MKKLLTIILILSTSVLFGQNISIGKEYGMKKTTGNASGKLGVNYYYDTTKSIAIGGTILPEQSSINNIPIGCTIDTSYINDTIQVITYDYGNGTVGIDTSIVKKDTPVIRTIRTINTDSTEGWNSIVGDWMPSGDGFLWPPRTWAQGNLLYRQQEITIDTIKVKALITTDKIKAPFEVELLWVRENNGGMTLDIYPPPVRLNKYLSLDKKELPATTTVWIAK